MDTSFRQPLLARDADQMSESGIAEIEIADSREAQVAGLTVRRSFPRRGRRTVGAWCFADHIGPVVVANGGVPEVGPHPHMGLQTVTWLIEGEALHRDSLGSTQLLRPGELNLMTAGSGLSHAEESTPNYQGSFHGVQLWIALPEATRNSVPEFSHYAELPHVELQASSARILIGEMAGETSPARHDTPLLGADLAIDGRVDLALREDFEYALIPLDGCLSVAGHNLDVGQSCYLAPGRSTVRLESEVGARTILLGGEPFSEPLLMWWNFVARTREEIDSAVASWQADDGRFGTVDSALIRIGSPAPYWQPR
jgi:hypothetical protein